MQKKCKRVSCVLIWQIVTEVLRVDEANRSERTLTLSPGIHFLLIARAETNGRPFNLPHTIPTQVIREKC